MREEERMTQRYGGGAKGRRMDERWMSEKTEPGKKSS
jgi:hypothetical protein